MRYFFLFLLLPFVSFAQQTINETMIHDGITRSYTIYVPANYTPGTPAPMVLNFHGYTSNAFEQMFYGVACIQAMPLNKCSTATSAQ